MLPNRLSAPPGDSVAPAAAPPVPLSSTDTKPELFNADKYFS